MKSGSVVSYSNYPILEKLNKGSLGVLPFYEKDKIYFKLFGEFFSNNWKLNNTNFKKEINVIREPFYNASLKASDKLIQLYKDILVNDISDFEIQGCYIYGDFVYMVNFDVKKDSEDAEVTFYIFTKKGIPIAMLINNGFNNKITDNIWISSTINIKNNTSEGIKEWIYYQLSKVIILKMFKTYAEVETKIIPPNSRIKDINCKHINYTNFQLTYLDSKWFTNLIKSDAFKVSGHFRLQPKKKNGEWTKELIWINEFEKSGYNSPARIIN